MVYWNERNVQRHLTNLGNQSSCSQNSGAINKGHLINCAAILIAMIEKEIITMDEFRDCQKRAREAMEDES